MYLEIIVALSIFIVSLLLIYINFDAALLVLLFLSVLLHKELFSIYKWDILPVRIFMFAFLIVGVWRLGTWWKKTQSLGKPPLRVVFRTVWQEPFILLLLLLWLVRCVSIVFSKNLFSSLTLLGFFTTMVALGIRLYLRFSKDSEGVFRYIKTYLVIVLGLCLFSYLQMLLYLKWEVIIGALWNVPGKLPRLGSVFWDVNHFGALLATTLPAIGVLALTSKGKKRMGYALAFLPILGILLLTNSRTAWIIAFIALVSFVMIQLFRKLGTRGIGIVLLVLAVVFGAFTLEYSNKESLLRAKVKDYFHYRIDSFDSHFMLLQGALEVFSKYPFFGGGYGGFFEHFAKTNVSAEYFGRDPAALNTRVPAHTIWGEVLAETGIAGLVTYCSLLTLILSTLLYGALTSRNLKESLLTSAMFSALLGWFIAGIFYSYKSEFFFLILFSYFLYGLSILKGKVSFEQILKYFFSRKLFPVLVLFGLSGFLIFIKLGYNHLIPWDEAIYAKVAKNMVESKSFLVQRWRSDIPWFEKPPLCMWLMALSMHVLGVNGWGVRLFSALFGLGTILLVYLFGKKLFGKVAGFIAGFSLLMSFHFLYYSRIGMLDVTATFFVTLSLVLYYLAKEQKVLKYWIYSGIACGLAIMTKSIVGLLPLSIIPLYEIYLFVSGEQSLSKDLVKRYGVFLTASFLVFLPWHLDMYRRFGKDFLNEYIGYHVLSRAISAIEDKGRPFFWYILVMRVSMRIWFVALLGALPFVLFRGIAKKDKRVVFFLIWSICIFLLFSTATSKLVWYIIPIYPALALIIGVFAAALLNFVIQEFPCLNNFMFRMVVLSGVVILGLFYLFLNRELVYVSDLTGPQAELLQLKSEEFGDDIIVYVDRIELPLVLFYLKGPFEIVDFGPLGEKLAWALYDERIVFITKESRFRKYASIYPELRLTAENAEWVLGYLPSRYDLDSDELENLQKVLRRVESKVEDLESKGEEVPPDLLEDLMRLRAEEEAFVRGIKSMRGE